MRLVGETLDPTEITRLLGVKPSTWNLKGEVPWVRGKQWGMRHPPPYGSWVRHVASRKPANLDAQVAELFAKLPNSKELWDDLADRYRGSVEVMLHIRPGSQNVGLLPQTMSAIADRRLLLEFSIFPLTEGAAAHALRKLQRTH